MMGLTEGELRVIPRFQGWTIRGMVQQNGTEKGKKWEHNGLRFRNIDLLDLAEHPNGIAC